MSSRDGKPGGARVSEVFINYRRRDDAYAAAFLDDYLSRQFGADRIFRAGRSIPAGEEYEIYIMAAIAKCHGMLILVGPDWVESFKQYDESEDWVRREIR